jgi:predicted transcriptional regulator
VKRSCPLEAQNDTNDQERAVAAWLPTTSQIVPHFDELMRRTVADVMTEAVVHVEPTAPLIRVLQLMVSFKSRSFPVISSDSQLLDLISREDVMRALKESTREAQ